MTNEISSDRSRDVGRAEAAAVEFDVDLSAALSTGWAATDDHAPASYYAEDTFEALDIFRGSLLNRSRFETLPQGMSEQVVAAVPGADMVGVTLLHHDSANPATIACSDARVVDVDTDQYAADEGPCLEAARTGRIVCVRVDEAAQRWPTFASAASEIGVRSFLSAPLAIDAEHAGSLNIDSFDDHGFSDVDEVLVTMFVTSVEAAVWNSRHTAEGKEESAGLRRAMATRGTIEQAKGVLIALCRVSPDAAFSMLVEQSQRENTKVAVLSARIVGAAVAFGLR